MKKWIIRIGIGVVVIVVVCVFLVAFFLEGIVKSGVEAVGPKITQTEVALSGVSLSLLNGAATIRGLVIGNPTGYKGNTALEAGEIHLDVEPSSLLSDKVIVRGVRVDGAKINVEGSATDNNLTKIQSNIEASLNSVMSGSSNAPAKSSGPGKKLQVDDFVISHSELSLTLGMLGGKTTTVALPDIHLANLGQGPDGITAAELSKRIIAAVTANVTQVVTDTVKKLGGAALDAAKDAGKTATDSFDKAGRGIKDMFKKKP